MTKKPITSTRNWGSGYNKKLYKEPRRKMKYFGCSSGKSNLMYVGRNTAEGILCRF